MLVHMTSRIPLSTHDRDLNKKVAQALGWKELRALKIHSKNSLLLEGISPREKCTEGTGFRSKQYVPNFAGDMNAALELIEDLRARGYHGVSLSRMPRRKKSRVAWSEQQWECFLEDPLGRRVAECAETPARAVCLALLNVLGEQVEKCSTQGVQAG